MARLGHLNPLETGAHSVGPSEPHSRPRHFGEQRKSCPCRGSNHESSGGSLLTTPTFNLHSVSACFRLQSVALSVVSVGSHPCETLIEISVRPSVRILGFINLPAHIREIWYWEIFEKALSISILVKIGPTLLTLYTEIYKHFCSLLDCASWLRWVADEMGFMCYCFKAVPFSFWTGIRLSLPSRRTKM